MVSGERKSESVRNRPLKANDDAVNQKAVKIFNRERRGTKKHGREEAQKAQKKLNPLWPQKTQSYFSAGKIFRAPIGALRRSFAGRNLVFFVAKGLFSFCVSCASLRLLDYASQDAAAP